MHLFPSLMTTRLATREVVQEVGLQLLALGPTANSYDVLYAGVQQRRQELVQRVVGVGDAANGTDTRLR